MKIDGIKKICLVVLKWAINSEKKKSIKLDKNHKASLKRHAKVQENYTPKIEKTQAKCKKKEQQIADVTQRIIEAAQKEEAKTKVKLKAKEQKVKEKLNARLNEEEHLQRSTLEEKTKHDSEVQRGERLITKIEELFE